MKERDGEDIAPGARRTVEEEPVVEEERFEVPQPEVGAVDGHGDGEEVGRDDAGGVAVGRDSREVAAVRRGVHGSDDLPVLRVGVHDASQEAEERGLPVSGRAVGSHIGPLP